jgi:prephenate dehydrogenase
MSPPHLVLVGVGLIGGSIGLAARRRGAAARVVGVDHNPIVLQQARERGLVDETCTDLARAAASADVMVFCVPVDGIAASVLAAASACRPGTLMTDAGSTKAAIVRALDGRLPPGVTFVGSHPLAGSEKHGPEHASAHLFEDRLVLITPGAHPEEQAVARTTAFWQSLGARVRLMAPDEHDEALALTSHLPHLLASALAGILPASLADLTATGFRDSTRLAASNPALWTAIFRANQSAVLAALTRLEEQLHHFRKALAEGDESALEALLQQGKTIRDALNR